MAHLKIYDDEVDQIIREWAEKKLGHKVDCVTVACEKGNFPTTRAVRTYAYVDWEEPTESPTHE